MLLRNLILAAVTLSGFSLAAHADTFSLINGNVTNGIQGVNADAGVVTGTVTFDTATFIASAANLTFADTTTGVTYSGFTSLGTTFYSSASKYLFLAVSDAASNRINLYVKTPAVGGDYSLCLQATEACGSYNDSLLIPKGKASDYFTSGSLTPQVLAATAPEPSSFILLGTGILGAAGAARRRYLTR